MRHSLRLCLLLVLFMAGLLWSHTTRMVCAGLVNLSAVQVVSGRPTEPMLQAAYTAQPDNVPTGRLRGYLLYHAGDYAGVVEALSGACNMQPPDKFSMLWLGLSYHELGSEAEALRCFSLGYSAPYLIRLGDQVLGEGSPAEAETWYMLAARADPGSEAAALALAHLYDQQQRTDQARQWYLRAIELSPKNAKTYVELAILVFKQMQDRPLAERYLHRAVEIAPDKIDALMWLGHIAYAHGEHASAIAWYRRATEVDPDSAWARWFLGARLCETREYEAGIQQLEYALSRNERDAIAYYELGRCYLGQGALDQAAESFIAAIRFETRDYYLARAYEGLGDVYLAQGNLSEAARQYRLALTFEPDNGNLARKLGDLDKKIQYEGQ